MIWNDKKFREEKTENTLIVKLLCKLICDQIKINKNQRFIFFENIRNRIKFGISLITILGCYTSKYIK